MSTIIHVDMDAFFAAVEVRDNPSLKGKPLIIGAMPNERGVVSTCSYEARKYGVRSAMPISQAYQLCPNGIYMYPSIGKYSAASKVIHKIWDDYTDLVEYVSLDEGYLDVTGSLTLFGSATAIGQEIKQRIKDTIGLTCSVGVGYNMMAAKLASEEKKPDGFFEILSKEALRELLIDRSVRTIYGVGPETANELQKVGITTVRDIYENRNTVIGSLGNMGRHILNLVDGIDDRKVVTETKSQSLSKEITFQQDTEDIEYLKDILRVIARELSYQISQDKLYVRTVGLKITYKGMKKITRQKSGSLVQRSTDIYSIAESLLNSIDMAPIRLIGISLSGFSDNNEESKQLSFFEDSTVKSNKQLDSAYSKLQGRYGIDVLKTASELGAEKRINSKEKKQ